MTKQEPGQELLFYTSPDSKVKMEIRIEGDTIWMSQQMMAELFQTTKQNISLHIDNILQSSELQEIGTVKENLTVRQEGTRKVQRKVKFYNLDTLPSHRNGKNGAIGMQELVPTSAVNKRALALIHPAMRQGSVPRRINVVIPKASALG